MCCSPAPIFLIEAQNLWANAAELMRAQVIFIAAYVPAAAPQNLRRIKLLKLPPLSVLLAGATVRPAVSVGRSKSFVHRTIHPSCCLFFPHLYIIGAGGISKLFVFRPTIIIYLLWGQYKNGHFMSSSDAVLCHGLCVTLLYCGRRDSSSRSQQQQCPVAGFVCNCRPFNGRGILIRSSLPPSVLFSPPFRIL